MGKPTGFMEYDRRDRRYEPAADRVVHYHEFTGRIRPAPCEAACTLNIDDSPVAIKTIECAIVDKAWEQGWIKP